MLNDSPAAATHRDVCVVGAGAAGIALAVELARRGRSVTLLEAGGLVEEESAQDARLGYTEGLPHRGLHGGRVRALGGTTNLWGGQILELDEIDFEKRSWIRGSGWPFSKSELTRPYARALEVENVAAAISTDELVWQRLDLHSPQLGSLKTYLSRWCPEANFATLHRQVLRSETVDVWLHANACELVLEDGNARGVRCATGMGAEHVFTANEYVFCLGAIESSRFFLQPREGGLPWNNSGLLGRHFQDHVDSDAATVELIDPRAFHDGFDAIFLDGRKYNPKVKLDPAVERKRETLRAGATFYSASGTDETLPALKATAKKILRGQLAGVAADEVLLLARQAPSLLRHGYRYAVHHRAYHPASSSMCMRVHCEQEPCSQSSIGLGRDRDQFGLLRASLCWTISELELRTIRTFVKVAARELADIARVIPHPELEQDAFRANCEDGYHHMGGMRMAESPQRGIVAPDLRLHGTTNVYVCSSAVFPCSGFSNPTHTLLALAMRLAEQLCR